MSWFNTDSTLRSIKKESGKLSMREGIISLLDHFMKDWESPTENFQILSDRIIFPLSLIETKSSYLVEAELPGVKKEDVKLDISNSMLTIKGEKKIFDLDNKQDYIRMERSHGHFNRSIQLPTEVDEKKVNASMNEGILKVEINKSADAMKKKRSISIQ